ncbi:MAG: HEAT repeat domain-containing protein [Candidatus Binatus sp.]|jgi:hypothetical protein|uniref:HEAT repeat domain-containing protein n=1 Tax=Candidatus Binatus sp. TaxID=2811406 RepID=UPI003D14EEB2
MNKKTLIAVTCCLAFSLSMPIRVNAGGAPPALVSADWSVKSAHSLATNPPSDEAEVALLNKLGSMFYTGICFSRFADLRHSGNLSLVVSASDGRFCYLSIIDKTPSGLELYGVDLARYSRGFEIEDLARNGNLELIVDTDFTGWRGLGTGPCVATWPVIYAWTGSGYTDVSIQYKGYYEQELASLKKQIAPSSFGTEEAQAPAAGQTPESAPTMVPVPLIVGESSSSSSSGHGAGVLFPAPAAASSPAAAPAATPNLRNADCTEAEAAKIERFLGISRDAGMSDAIKWANSDDPNRREFACYVLQDIGTGDAIEYLRTLSNDSDRTVAAAAKESLRAVGKGPALNTIDRAEVEQPVAGSPPK